MENQKAEIDDLNAKIKEYVDRLIEVIFGSEIKDEKEVNHAREVLTNIAKFEAYHIVNMKSKYPNLKELQSQGMLAKLRTFKGALKDISGLSKKDIKGYKMALASCKFKSKDQKGISSKTYFKSYAQKLIRGVSTATFFRDITKDNYLASKVAMAMKETLRKHEIISECFPIDSEIYKEIIEELTVEESSLQGQSLCDKENRGYIEDEKRYSKGFNKVLDYIAIGEIVANQNHEADMEVITECAMQLFKESALIGSFDSEKPTEEKLQEVLSKITRNIRLEKGYGDYSNEECRELINKLYERAIKQDKLRKNLPSFITGMPLNTKAFKSVKQEKAIWGVATAGVLSVLALIISGYSQLPPQEIIPRIVNTSLRAAGKMWWTIPIIVGGRIYSKIKKSDAFKALSLEEQNEINEEIESRFELGKDKEEKATKEME